ncbi:nitroreductase family protein [Patescibacteria group bacterium]
MDFFDLIHKRQSVRSFTDEKISDDDIIKILEAAIKAPSAGNLQAFEIYVVKDKEKKLELSVAALDQDSIKEASHCIVFCAHPELSKSKYDEMGEKVYCIEDTTIACAYAQLAAANLGYGSVWVGAIEEDKLRKVLSLDESLVPVSILPIGIPNEEPDSKPRRDFNDIVHNL